MSPSRPLALALLLVCTACKPPASDDYVSRMTLTRQAETFASDPLPSPDAKGAVWAAGAQPLRILYGVPGKMPFLAIRCDTSTEVPRIDFTRFSPADREAKAIMALIGNGHVERFEVTARNNGRAWLWEGGQAADSAELDVLTGSHDVELTIPGAGSLMLHPSPLPGKLIDACSDLTQIVQSPEASTSPPG